jgi:hypothetical protein
LINLYSIEVEQIGTLTQKNARNIILLIISACHSSNTKSKLIKVSGCKKINLKIQYTASQKLSNIFQGNKLKKIHLNQLTNKETAREIREQIKKNTLILNDSIDTINRNTFLQLVKDKKIVQKVSDYDFIVF